MKSRIKFFSNLKTFLSLDVKNRIADNTRRIIDLEDVVSKLDVAISNHFEYNRLMEYYLLHQEEMSPYRRELTYLESVKKFCNFPYSLASPKNPVQYGVDDSRMPYVIHNGERLFFPYGTPTEEMLSLYDYYVHVEKLLEKEDSEDAPHQYQSPRVQVSEGDTLFDIGAAEGLFCLDNIKKVSKAVIVESDPKWLEPLKKTFSPFKDKVVILNSFISANDTESTVSLSSLIRDFNCQSAFFKMDIEGYELPAIMSSIQVIQQLSRTKMAIATYHKQNDFVELKSVFDGIGYYSESSDGYMLFNLYDVPMPPFFRKGIIRVLSPDLKVS